MGVARDCHPIKVVVAQTWRWRGVDWHEGRRLLVPAGEYRKWRSVGEFLEREYVRCRHWSGVEYLHAVACGGRLLGPVSRPPRRLETYKAREAPPPPVRKGTRCGERRRKRA